ncbi:MAG: hypothetical protein JO031_00735, partial [Ktedonobacteraceae bacterium]|nr:hypothetical protein [Ktedonobacteraceae bacterium]
LRTMLLAFLPFIAWELFSLFYYGFLFPNTAYAKLNTGISTGQLLKQGLAYLISSSSFDPLLFIVPICAILLVVASRDRRSIPLVIGMALYVAYVAKVGGDFMAGRFLTPPLLMAVILLVRNIPSSAKTLWATIFIVVIFLGFFVPNSRWYVINTSNIRAEDARGVADEHAYYAKATGLINFQRNVSMPNSVEAQYGLQVKLDNEQVAAFNAIGYFGYEAGPHVHVLDNLALGDPLLARLPMDPQKLQDWRIGHFYRTIPPGYLQTLDTGVNVIQDPGLAQYYTKLHDVTSGPLFDGQRLLEIWNFNTGAYNSLLRHYVRSISPPPQNPVDSTLYSEQKILSLPDDNQHISRYHITNVDS